MNAKRARRTALLGGKPMLAGTKWLLIAEINNEADGGESPATVCSALEEHSQRLQPRP